ncbi:MAG: ABC transporter substrate-binding protein [Lachnospiraceae bacterium]
MKKRLLGMILAVCMISGAFGCSSFENFGGKIGGNTEDSTDAKTALQEPVKLVMSFRINGTAPAEAQIDRIEAALNEILREKINAEIELIIIPSASYKQQMTLLLSGNEQLDVMGIVPQMTPAAVAGGQLLDLTVLLQTYGQGILNELPEELLGCGMFDGVQYTIPIQADTAVGMGFYVMRKDIVRKYDIDIDSVKTYEDLTKVFQIVHDNEPELTIVAPRNAGMSFLEYNCSWDKLGDFFGVLENYGQDDLEVVNLFETQAYKEYLAVMRDWYQRGFISTSVTIAAEGAPALVNDGTLFAYAHANKPGGLTQESISAGHEMVGCQVLESINGTLNAWQWTIPANSKNPEKAMEFLNLLYTDPDVINLLAYGIEGEDYVVHADGRIGYPGGLDSSPEGYSMAGMLWSFGNEFNAHVWETNDLDIWEQTREWNKNGITSKAFGFVFDSTPVSMEIAAVQNVYDQYRMALECGLVEPAAALDEMNQTLYAAGLQEVINEKQRQLNQWAALNN